MMSGIQFKPREVILVSITFPAQLSKIRPVLVISKFSKDTSREIFVCLPITSSSRYDPYAIQINDSDVQEGEFIRPSKVLCQYYFTVLKTTVTKKIAEITPQFFQQIKTKIYTEILDL